MSQLQTSSIPANFVVNSAGNAYHGFRAVTNFWESIAAVGLRMGTRSSATAEKQRVSCPHGGG